MTERSKKNERLPDITLNSTSLDGSLSPKKNLKKKIQQTSYFNYIELYHTNYRN
jgi:hypothetical protein